ncbi:hypothetical protein F5X68DRAFT_236988 [Plectosphaerella plurivora]|uniref:Uncharacterized protein n=1 Tax=Plectosphaerella plurivora TaxID=936078 RepID=A0A9P9A6P1_9PEZI|nr:hypothetical protein F5X68DRAFT_236988 [Plectosphaerella plurivora]
MLDERKPDIGLEAHLAYISGDASRARIESAIILRHHADAMREFGILAVAGPCAPESAAYAAEYDRSMANLRSTIPILEARAAALQSYGTSVMERSGAQISISALRTHYDSRVNLKVAEAAKRDSSAMKTIAAMTMAFLPAIFLAALFALPAIEWERKMHVETDGFVLFWAVSIPLTVIVFLVCAFITQREWIWGLLEDKLRRNEMKE